MSKCVIKVGNLYYSGIDRSGHEQFVHASQNAMQFDEEHQSHTAHGIAQDIGGEVLPYVGEAHLATPTDIDVWMQKHAPYILNCTGPIAYMLQYYLTWSTQFKREYDMSSYIGGVPCVLRVSAFDGKDRDEDASRFHFAFTLHTTGELTPEQETSWDSSDYGILLLDGTRLLVSDFDELLLDVPAFPRYIIDGKTRVKDTKERRSLIAEYEASLKKEEKKSHPLKSFKRIKKMSLQE